MKDWILSFSDQETSSVFPLVYLKQHAAGSPTKCKDRRKKKKEIKWMPIKREEIKLDESQELYWVTKTESERCILCGSIYVSFLKRQNYRNGKEITDCQCLRRKEMATHSSTLVQKIPWTEEPGAGYCPWGPRESDTTERFHFTSIKEESGYPGGSDG